MNIPLPDLGLKTHYEPLVGGAYLSLTDDSFPAVDATTGRTLATITRSGKAEVNRAVAAAKAAFPAWAATRPQERAALLLRLADWIEENAERLALIDVLDIGRTAFELPQDYRQALGQY